MRYEINPWMDTTVPVDLERAAQQWEGLCATLTAAGAWLEVLDPLPTLPDLVFTANAGVVHGGLAVPSRFRHPERAGEADVDAAWFAAAGLTVERLPPGLAHEGAGDLLPFGAVLVGGAGPRSDAPARSWLAERLGRPLVAVALVDPRYYHLDMTFCPLDDRRAILHPGAWDEAGRRAVAALVPEPLVLEPDEAAQLVANSVVVGTTVIMSTCPTRVGRQLERWGFEVVEASVSEFNKAGGGCRCLTLALDGGAETD